MCRPARPGFPVLQAQSPPRAVSGPGTETLEPVVAADAWRQPVPQVGASGKSRADDRLDGATSDLPGPPRRAGAQTAEHTAGRCRTRRMGSPGGGPSMSAGMRSAVSWLSFLRIIDIPFEMCVAALESWQRMGQGGELHIGQSLLRWPIEQDRDHCACRIEAGLARGPLRLPLRMRLDISCWSPSSTRTVLELIPDQRVRPTAAYFRSGHLLLDSLTQSLLRHLSAQQLDHVPAAPSNCRVRSTRKMRNRRSWWMKPGWSGVMIRRGQAAVQASLCSHSALASSGVATALAGRSWQSS